MAQTAALMAERTYEEFTKQKPTIPKMENGKPVTDAKGRPVRIPNPRYAATLPAVIELIRRSTELVRLLAGSSGSLDAQQRQEHRDALLAKLTKMAETLRPPQPAFDPFPEVEEPQEPVAPAPVGRRRTTPSDHFPTHVAEPKTSSEAIVVAPKLDLMH